MTFGKVQGAQDWLYKGAVGFYQITRPAVCLDAYGDNLFRVDVDAGEVLAAGEIIVASLEAPEGAAAYYLKLFTDRAYLIAGTCGNFRELLGLARLDLPEMETDRFFPYQSKEESLDFFQDPAGRSLRLRVRIDFRKVAGIEKLLQPNRNEPRSPGRQK